MIFVLHIVYYVTGYLIRGVIVFVLLCLPLLSQVVHVCLSQLEDVYSVVVLLLHDFGKVDREHFR